MKIVVSNSQVAHLWANQSQEHARSSSMSFRGTKCYSYSTCIAALHDVPNNRGFYSVALINSRKYSSTTSSRHMPAVSRALNGLGFTLFSVPEVSDYDQGPLSARQHLLNQNYLETKYTTHAKRLMRAMSLGPWQRDELMRLADNARSYAGCFSLLTPSLDTLQDWDNAQRRRARLDNDPKAIARRDAKATARLACEARDRLSNEQRNVEYLARFRDGTNMGYYSGLVDRDGAAYLRVTADGQTVQTSRGASVPAADAIRAIRFIRAVKYLRKSDWKRNGEQCPVGQLQVDRINADGDIHAGCHFIKWSEIDATAQALGMIGPV